MTREEMRQIMFYVHEIKAIEKSLESPKAAYVNVFYKDYRTGYGIAKSRCELDEGQEQIRILTGSLKAYKRKLAAAIVKAEKFIESIEDSEMRTILRMYYMNGSTQEEIGEELNYTSARISQKIIQFWKSQGESKRSGSRMYNRNR